MIDGFFVFFFITHTHIHTRAELEEYFWWERPVLWNSEELFAREIRGKKIRNANALNPPHSSEDNHIIKMHQDTPNYIQQQWQMWKPVQDKFNQNKPKFTFKNTCSESATLFRSLVETLDLNPKRIRHQDPSSLVQRKPSEPCRPSGFFLGRISSY